MPHSLGFFLSKRNKELNPYRLSRLVSMRRNFRFVLIINRFAERKLSKCVSCFVSIYRKRTSFNETFFTFIYFSLNIKRLHSAYSFIGQIKCCSIVYPIGKTNVLFHSCRFLQRVDFGFRVHPIGFLHQWTKCHFQLDNHLLHVAFRTVVEMRFDIFGADCETHHLLHASHTPTLPIIYRRRTQCK